MRTLESILLSVLVALVAIGALLLVGDIVRDLVAAVIQGFAAVPG